MFNVRGTKAGQLPERPEKATRRTWEPVCKYSWGLARNAECFPRREAAAGWASPGAGQGGDGTPRAHSEAAELWGKVWECAGDPGGRPALMRPWDPEEVPPTPRALVCKRGRIHPPSVTCEENPADGHLAPAIERPWD